MLKWFLAALVTVIVAPSFVRADCPRVLGDVAPGFLEQSTEPPTWSVQGNEAVDIGDVIALLRAAVGLQSLAWLEPTERCDPVPGDYAPGVVLASELGDRWVPDGDREIDIGDVVAVLRASA